MFRKKGQIVIFDVLPEEYCFQRFIVKLLAEKFEVNQIFLEESTFLASKTAMSEFISFDCRAIVINCIFGRKLTLKEFTVIKQTKGIACRPFFLIFSNLMNYLAANKFYKAEVNYQGSLLCSDSTEEIISAISRSVLKSKAQ